MEELGLFYPTPANLKVGFKSIKRKEIGVWHSNE